jgi:hypothetical protein
MKVSVLKQGKIFAIFIIEQNRVNWLIRRESDETGLPFSFINFLHGKL